VIANRTSIVLNQDQQNSADELNAFLDNPDAKEFCITGQAGTGKTYMLYSVLGTRALYCATTNKAAAVLRALTGSADTIHSLLGVIVKNDYKTGKTSLVRNSKSKPIVGAIIVIDEASMIDKQLYAIIRDLCAYSKIIYVGDDAQLPPVSSGAFSIFKLNLPTTSLTQVMRSLDMPDITELSTALRAAVFNGHNITVSDRPPAIARLTSTEAFERVTSIVKEDKWHNCVLLSFTNARATEAAGHIRRAADKPSELLAGDTVIVNTAFEVGKEWIPTDSLLVIDSIDAVDNSEDLIVVHTDEGDFITFKDNSKLQKLIATAGAQKDWNEYFRLKQTYIDLRHAEALTIHKSQGSTFDTVFVDVASLAQCRDPNARRRLLYVACSRARKQLYLVV
jgi:ATP-dependent exoDNAse (exonuclease V) alpha subunit